LLSDPILKATLGRDGSRDLPAEYGAQIEDGTGTRTVLERSTKTGWLLTGSAEPAEEIHHSWAYPLPHRGDTVGDGDGWSRLTDGSEKLLEEQSVSGTSAFTGEDDTLHPQWILIDLSKKVEIDAIRIAWANPYATGLRSSSSGPVT